MADLTPEAIEYALKDFREERNALFSLNEDVSEFDTAIAALEAVKRVRELVETILAEEVEQNYHPGYLHGFRQALAALEGEVRNG